MTQANRLPKNTSDPLNSTSSFSPARQHRYLNLPQPTNPTFLLHRHHRPPTQNLQSSKPSAASTPVPPSNQPNNPPSSSQSPTQPPTQPKCTTLIFTISGPYSTYLTSHHSDAHPMIRKRDLQNIDPSEGAGDCENWLGRRDSVRSGRLPFWRTWGGGVGYT